MAYLPGVKKKKIKERGKKEKEKNREIEHRE